MRSRAYEGVAEDFRILDARERRLLAARPPALPRPLMSPPRRLALPPNSTQVPAIAAIESRLTSPNVIKKGPPVGGPPGRVCVNPIRQPAMPVPPRAWRQPSPRPFRALRE